QQELGAQLLAVGLYGMYGEPQLLRDVAGALAVADELEDFELPRAELPHPGRAAASPVEHQLEEPVGQLLAEVALTGRRGANRPDDGARRLLFVHVAVGAAAQGPLSIEGLAVGAQDHDFDVGVARSDGLDEAQAVANQRMVVDDEDPDPPVGHGPATRRGGGGSARRASSDHDRWAPACVKCCTTRSSRPPRAAGSAAARRALHSDTA